MTPLHKFPALATLLAALTLAPHLSQLATAQTPRRGAVVAARQTVREFFGYHFSHDKGFTERNLRLRRRWLTPELYGALRAELRGAAARARSRPDEAPFIDGDPFTDSQEYPDGFRVGKAIRGGNRVEVEVTFTWGARRRPADREQTALVIVDRRGARWLVANIVGGNGEDLLSLLRRQRD